MVRRKICMILFVITSSPKKIKVLHIFFFLSVQEKVAYNGDIFFSLIMSNLFIFHSFFIFILMIRHGQFFKKNLWSITLRNNGVWITICVFCIDV